MVVVVDIFMGSKFWINVTVESIIYYFPYPFPPSINKICSQDSIFTHSQTRRRRRKSFFFLGNLGFFFWGGGGVWILSGVGCVLFWWKWNERNNGEIGLKNWDINEWSSDAVVMDNMPLVFLILSLYFFRSIYVSS